MNNILSPSEDCINARIAGTVIHGTRTALLLWFWAIYLVATDKRGLSALGLSENLGLSYWRAWMTLQKIRRGMRDRDSDYKLAGIVEMDDSFFGGPKEGGDKRGRGSSKTTLIVEASTNAGSVGYAKTTVVDHVDGATVEALVKADTRVNQTLKTDGFPAYNIVGQSGHKHQRELVKCKKAHEVLTGTHILISNTKSFILSAFHGIGKKHLQAYLDEFCYRFNR